MLTEGKVLFTIENREYVMTPGDIVFINSNYLHTAKSVCDGVCSFYAVDFSYQVLNEDIHSIFSKKYIRPVLMISLYFLSLCHYVMIMLKSGRKT